MVKTGFLSSGNRFLLFDFFLQMQAATEINGPFFFGGGKYFIPARNREFLSGEKCFILFRASFLRAETVSETS